MKDTYVGLNGNKVHGNDLQHVLVNGKDESGSSRGVDESEKISAALFDAKSGPVSHGLIDVTLSYLFEHLLEDRRWLNFVRTLAVGVRVVGAVVEACGKTSKTMIETQREKVGLPLPFRMTVFMKAGGFRRSSP